MSIGDVAAKLGFPVFPCGDNKRPVVESGFKAASGDPREIRDLFARTGATMIGMPTGAVSGLVAIDIDIRESFSGRDWLDLNADALPPTRTHKTRSGGLHLIFLAPDDIQIRNSASRIAPGVDVRGEGGYIIVPPSPGYQVADPTEPADMPLWLIRACCKPERVSTEFTGTLIKRHEGGTPYGLAALNGECSAIARAADGAKHYTLNKSAYSIAGLVANGELSESEARAGLRDALGAIRDRCDDFAAAERTLEQAFAAGMAAPRSKPPTRESVGGAPPPDHTRDDGYWASLEADMAMTPAEWDEIHDREAGKTTPVSAALKARVDKELLWSITEPWDEAKIPPRPWITRGYLMRSAVTVVSGPGSAGKSSLMVAWASALTVGCSWGRFKVTEPLKVVTYNVEDDADEQKRRFSATLGRLGLKPTAANGRLAILGPRDVGTLFHMPRDGRAMLNTPVMERLINFIEEFEPDVVILDPFVELHTAEENDNTGVRAVMAAFRALAVSRHISVVILHHARKGAGTPGDPDSLRGASSIVGAARVALTLNVMTEDEAKSFGISLERRRDYFRLDGAKSNYAPIGEAEWFERQERRLANDDGVAVAWPWTPPNLLKESPISEINQVLQAIHEGPRHGVLYAMTRRGRSNDRWVGYVVASMLGGTDQQASEIVNKWKSTGLIYEEVYQDREQRKPAQGVRVDFSKMINDQNEVSE